MLFDFVQYKTRAATALLAFGGLIVSAGSASAGDCAYTSGYLEIKDNFTGACGQFSGDNGDWSKFRQKYENGNDAGKTWLGTADRFHNHGNHCEVRIYDNDEPSILLKRTRTRTKVNFGRSNYWVLCDN